MSPSFIEVSNFLWSAQASFARKAADLGRAAPSQAAALQRSYRRALVAAVPRFNVARNLSFSGWALNVLPYVPYGTSRDCGPF
jgi:hypothetical protein